MTNYINSLLGWLTRSFQRSEPRQPSVPRTSQNSTGREISPEESIQLVQHIEEKGWWQGSVLNGGELTTSNTLLPPAEFLVVASQTCNLYNKDFIKVPFVEFVGAQQIQQFDGAKAKGDNPRLLHVEATSKTSALNLELDIQHRLWVPRQLLAQLPISPFRLRDSSPGQQQPAKDWNDTFAGWLARSYTRVALPDEFNNAFKASRIEKSIEAKLARRPDDIYGIYFVIDADSDSKWTGALGEMPPPYLLGMVIVVEEHVDAELLRVDFVKHLFDPTIPDPENQGSKISRVDLAKRQGIRIVAEDVTVRSVAEITLKEMRQLIRFTMVDHLSDSSMAAGE